MGQCGPFFLKNSSVGTIPELVVASGGRHRRGMASEESEIRSSRSKIRPEFGEEVAAPRSPLQKLRDAFN